MPCSVPPSSVKTDRMVHGDPARWRARKLCNFSGSCAILAAGGAGRQSGQPMIRVVVALAAALLGIVAGALPTHAQVGFDRRGGDYFNFTIRSGDPAVCAARCDREARCRAWSFNFPTAERPAMCWLKSQVPRRVEESGSASGVRGAGVIEPQQDGREFSIDRPGADLRQFDVTTDPSGESCKMACADEARC